jgi:chromosome segregation ATPase
VKRSGPLIAAALLLIAVVGLMIQIRSIRRQSVNASALQAENTRLRAQNLDLTQKLAAAAAAPKPEPAPDSAPAETHAAKPAFNAEEVIALNRLKQNLADANAAVSRLQARADEDEAKLQNLTVDNKRLSASETDLKESLSAANQTVDALQRELKSKADRVTQVEVAYQKLRDQAGGDSQKLAQFRQLATELQDIHQRREVYLNSILRRYKQITDQYRAMSAVLDSRHNDAPAGGSADVARIQDSIAMAEEDLRQLNSLNAQALRIQKKLAGP